MERSAYLYIIKDKLYEVYYKYGKRATYRYIREYGSQNELMRYYDYGRKKSLGMAQVLSEKQAKDKYPQYFI